VFKLWIDLSWNTMNLSNLGSAFQIKPPRATKKVKEGKKTPSSWSTHFRKYCKS
jgi:hypothetical protein